MVLTYLKGFYSRDGHFPKMLHSNIRAHKKKHSRSSRANGKIKQTVPITVHNVGYIYASQPIFIVFK